MPGRPDPCPWQCWGDTFVYGCGLRLAGVAVGFHDPFLGVRYRGGVGHFPVLLSSASLAWLVGVHRCMACTRFCVRLVGGLWAGRSTGGVQRSPKGRRRGPGDETRCRDGCCLHIHDGHQLSLLSGVWSPAVLVFCLPNGYGSGVRPGFPPSRTGPWRGWRILAVPGPRLLVGGWASWLRWRVIHGSGWSLRPAGTRCSSQHRCGCLAVRPSQGLGGRLPLPVRCCDLGLLMLRVHLRGGASDHGVCRVRSPGWGWGRGAVRLYAGGVWRRPGW